MVNSHYRKPGRSKKVHNPDFRFGEKNKRPPTILEKKEQKSKKISRAMKSYYQDRKETTEAEREKSRAHRKKISDAMKEYWA